jgi:hypothetical protein
VEPIANLSSLGNCVLRFQRERRATVSGLPKPGDLGQVRIERRRIPDEDKLTRPDLLRHLRRLEYKQRDLVPQPAFFNHAA